MNGSGLAVAVLKHVTVAAVQNAGLAETQCGRMLAGLIPSAARLDAHQLHVLVIDKRVEDPSRIAAAAHASHDDLGQPAGLL